MSVSVAEDRTVLLQGVCALEDAEVLLRCLAVDPEAGVDWSACEQAHTAVIQVLLATKVRIVGFPTNSFLRDHLSAFLQPAD